MSESAMFQNYFLGRLPWSCPPNFAIKGAMARRQDRRCCRHRDSRARSCHLRKMEWLEMWDMATIAKSLS